MLVWLVLSVVLEYFMMHACIACFEIKLCCWCSPGMLRCVKCKGSPSRPSPDHHKKPRFIYQKKGKRRIKIDRPEEMPQALMDVPAGPELPPDRPARGDLADQEAVEDTLQVVSDTETELADEAVASDPKPALSVPVATPCRAMVKGWHELPPWQVLWCSHVPCML